MRLRAALPSPGRMLASWKLSVVLMASGALFYALLAFVAAISPSPIVQRLGGLSPFWLLWLLLLANLVVGVWRRFPGFLREALPASLAKRHGPRWRRSLADDADDAAVRRLLSGHRFACRATEEPGLRGVRRRFGALGTVGFHGAICLAAAGLVLTMAGRIEYTAAVAVGERLTGSDEQLRGGASIAVDDPFTVTDIAPALWGDELLFTSLEAGLVLADGSRERIRINEPLWRGWGRFVRLTNFGYAPAYQIVDRRGQVLDAAIVKLQVFPPGARDHFSPEGLPHRIYLEVLPDVEDRSAELATASLNLRKPLLLVHVTRGKLTVATGQLRLGEELEFEGLRVRFPEIRYFGEFGLLSDPGAPLLFAGFALAFLGLVLRALGRRAEIVWTPGPGGRGGELAGYGAAEPLYDEPLHDEPSHDEPSHDEPPHDEPPHDEPSRDEPPHDEPSRDEEAAT